MPTIPATFLNTLGLRSRTWLAATLLASVVLIFAGWIGYGLVDDLQDQLAATSVRHHVLLNQQRILAIAQRELALSQRLADASVTREWLASENNAALQARFFREAEGYRQAFHDRSFFIATAGEHRFYHYGANDTPETGQQIRYLIRANDPSNAWFFATLQSPLNYNINVDYDIAVQATKLWVNVAVRDSHGRELGVAGTGINLDDFVAQFIANTEPGMTNLLVNARGSIVAHPDVSQIEQQGAAKDVGDKTLFKLLADEDERAALTALLADLKGHPDQIKLLPVHLDGRPQLLAATWIDNPELYVISTRDASARSLLDHSLLVTIGVTGIGLLALLFILITYGVDRAILRPLAELTAVARRMAQGDYHARLHNTRQDELGALASTFDSMAAQVLEHTERLEQHVAERTQALQHAHAELAATHDKLLSSIQYASQIQHVILPQAQLSEDFPDAHFTLWAPRDVVSGDLYMYRRHGTGRLFGIVDCAGHGVPGAFMTLLAHAALDLALRESPAEHPDSLLTRIDQAIRELLPAHRERFSRIVTTMDMGLCWLDPQQRRLVFAGAHIHLYHYRQGECQVIPGHRRSLCHRRPEAYTRHELIWQPGDVIYLTTDGYLDQTGGPEGFSLGERSFTDWIAHHGHEPLPQQAESLHALLADYQGQQPRLDDITIVALRLT